MKKAALLIGTLVTTAGLPVAGATGCSDPAFEAATLRPNTSGYAGWRLQPQPGGRLTGTNVPAAALIRFAYNLPDFQISGGPGWLASDRFDVEAKAEGDPPIDQKRLMLRTLLAERFKLTVHTETRELPIYALVMARSDGRPGPSFAAQRRIARARSSRWMTGPASARRPARHAAASLDLRPVPICRKAAEASPFEG